MGCLYRFIANKLTYDSRNMRFPQSRNEPVINDFRCINKIRQSMTKLDTYLQINGVEKFLLYAKISLDSYNLVGYIENVSFDLKELK